MQETVKKAGLRSIRQFKTANWEEARDWLKEQNITEFIVKPIKSAGTNLFHFGHDEATLKQAFHNILSEVDVFGDVNIEALVQERIMGQEFAINTVSYAGEHYISEICKYKKIATNEGGNIYDKITIESFDIPEFEQIRQYVFSVLTALDIKYGPAHTEIFLTDGELVLVETGARLMGASIPAFFDACVGHNQLDLTLQAYTAPKDFLNYIKQPYPILKAFGMYVLLISSSERQMKAIDVSFLKKLRSYYDFHLYISQGEKLIRTKDLMSSPGVVYLCNSNKMLVDDDYQALRQTEKENLLY